MSSIAEPVPRLAGRSKDTPEGVARRFWGLFLPIFGLVALCALAVGLLAERNVEADVERPAIRVAAQLKTHLDDVLLVYADALRSMTRREPRLIRQFNAATPDLEVVADEFLTMLSRADDRFQIRWIDEKGIEKVRLDQDGSGVIRRVGDADLQDKSGRPYVVAGLGLAPGEVYVSALDLNVEHGVISQPHVPTLRLVSRVFDRAGGAHGIFVLNVHAARILDRFRAISGATRTYLLNADGFWLSSVRSEDEWGFMLGRGETFGQRHPAVWAEMGAQAEGRLMNASGFWTWTTPTVLPEFAEGDPSLRWRIVAHVPPAEIRDRCAVAWGIVGASALLILAVAAWSLWRFSVAAQGRLQAQQAYRREAELLADANRSLKQSIENQRVAERGLKAAVERLTVSRSETEAARQEAERANRAKSAFLANTSHEIRTPLNAVIGSAYLLGLTKLSGEQRKHVETIGIASRSLLELIDDVLDLSKIEAGEMQLDPVPFAPAALLGELRSMFDALARHKGLALKVLPLPAEIPPSVIGDVRRFKQILANLLSNAIKFTDQGSVTVGMEAVDPAPAAGDLRLRCWVTDTGIGVPQALRDKLFAPFVQADVSTSRRFGGTGLGLSIVRHLSEMLGGRAGLDRVEGEGSTFWFEVLVERAEAASSASEAAIAEGQLRLVVAVGDAAERQVMVQIGERFNWQVDTVDSGRALVERVLKTYESGLRLDGVLADWHLPEMDGIEAIKRIRTRLWDVPLAGVVMVPAAEDAEFRRQDGAMLADAVVTKPIDASSLFNAMNGAACAHGLGVDHVMRHTRIDGNDCQWLYGIRVLVVDDSPMNLDVCQRILEHEGAVVTVCRSGEDVLARMSTVGERYDAVLMDMQMPGMDGCAVTRGLRQAEAWRTVPVIALTASAIASERDRAFASGMNDFLAKPIDPAALVLSLRSHVERVRDEPVSVVPRQAEPRGDEVSFPAIEGIDRRFAMRQLQGDQVLFFSLLRSFSTEHAHAVARLGSLIDGRDIDAAAAYLERLQSQAGYLAASAVFDHAQALNAALVDGADTLPTLRQQFEETIQGFLQAIEPWTQARPGPQAELGETVPTAEVLTLVGELRGLLKSFALSAENCARRIVDILRDSSWLVRFEPILDLVEGLRYDEALAALWEFEVALKGGKGAGAPRRPQAENL